MSEKRPHSPVVDAGIHFLRSARFSAALTHTIIGATLGSLFIRELIGWPGLLGILGTLVVLAALSLLAKQRTIEWHGLLPVSLLVFVGWAAASAFWSQYQWATFGSVVYLGAVTMLGIYVALARDTIQIARAFGDVLRIALVLSLALEIFSGLLIDSPIRFLDIQGHLDTLGPIEGIFGTRNQLGIVALVALITFGIELRTRSVSRGLAVGSLVTAGICLLLAHSPLAAGALVLVGLAALALYGLRRLAANRRRFWQLGLLLAAVALAGFAWAFRTQLITFFSASAELMLRLRLWQQVRGLIPLNELNGWGWVGQWRQDVSPFQIFLNYTDHTPTSALNAFFDVWFQLGLVGLFAFVILLGLAFVRSWLLASNQRSIVYAWPALVLVVLLSTALAESSLLVEFGWLTFVVCCVKAARELSWRKAFAATAPPSVEA
ncbi:MAG: O-antigen ligase family protein [Lacisediminihabitans sp.]